MVALSILSIAVASGKAGFVLMYDGKLKDWGITVKSAKTGADLVGFVQELINELRPDIIVTEDCTHGCRKGKKTKKLIASVSALASHNTVLDVSVVRPRAYPSKYDEAHALTVRYPEIAGYLPTQKRRIFDFEPRSMVLFEAIVLAEEVSSGPPTRLAMAMG